MEDLPKNIWTYWHQGFDSAPYLVKKCVEQWKALHPDWNIYLLDEKNVSDFIDVIPIEKEQWEKLIIPHRSDLIRTQLLINHGGVWADPTCYPLQSLDSWLPTYISSGLFLFAYPGRDRIISNWFIGAQKGNYFLKKLYKELCEYWHQGYRNQERDCRRVEKLANQVVNRNLTLTRLWFSPLFKQIFRWFPYMVYHYKFYDLICTDRRCREIWEAMSKFSSQIPHKLQDFGLLAPLNESIKGVIDKKESPLFKLTWKLEQPKIPEDSVLYYLLSR